MQDYHIHTYLCGHATGAPEEYVEVAISKDIDFLGFSDHNPLPHPEYETIAMKYEKLSEYVRFVLRLKDDYKDKISISLGLEVDYPFMTDLELLFQYPFDYFIGSVHFIDGWGFDNPEYIDIYERWDYRELVSKYYSIVISLIESGFFQILGHLDLIKKFAIFENFYPEDKINRIIELLKKHNMAVEINTSGLRKPVKEIYPSRYVIEKLFEGNIPIVFSSDAHSPEEVGFEIEKAIEMAKRIGYRYFVVFREKRMLKVLL